jgi:lysophospholipase L1-like esterase
MPQLFLFGDSITWGAWDPVGGGWAQRLRKVVDSYQVTNPSFWCPVYNLGISGDTSAGVANRLIQETLLRRDQDEETIFLIAIGINDSIINLRNSKEIVTEEMYVENLDQMLGHARTLSKKIGFIGLTPVDDALTDPLSWAPTKAYRLERVKSFNSTLQEFCRRTTAEFLPILDSWIDADYRSLLSDGLHPNAAGHERLFQAAKMFLIERDFLRTPF